MAVLASQLLQTRVILLRGKPPVYCIIQSLRISVAHLVYGQSVVQSNDLAIFTAYTTGIYCQYLLIVGPVATQVHLCEYTSNAASVAIDLSTRLPEYLCS